MLTSDVNTESAAFAVGDLRHGAIALRVELKSHSGRTVNQILGGVVRLYQNRPRALLLPVLRLFL